MLEIKNKYFLSTYSNRFGLYIAFPFPCFKSLPWEPKPFGKINL